MNGWGCAILALDLVPKIYFLYNNRTQELISQDFTPVISVRMVFMSFSQVLAKKVRNSQIFAAFVSMSAIISVYNLVFHNNLTQKFIQG